MHKNQSKTHVCTKFSGEYKKEKIFCLRHIAMDKPCRFFFLNFSFRHSNVFFVLKKLHFSLKHLNFWIFKIWKKMVNFFFIFLKNFLKNSLCLIEYWDKEKLFYVNFVHWKYIWFDERHYVINIIVDFIYLLNSRSFVIMIKVKRSMAAVN